MVVIVERKEANMAVIHVAAIDTHWQTTFPPATGPPHVQHGRIEDLGGKGRQFKTISFVLYVLYLTYSIPLVNILHTIDSQ